MKNNAIKTYGDIIRRIVEIIKLSKNTKNELAEDEIKENFNNHFTYILYNDIENSLVSEFKELIDAERTFTIMDNESPLVYLDKTRELLAMCEEKSDPNYGNYTYYVEIIQIIGESYGKSALDLTEYKGYYILRERFNKWLWLMRKLDLFPEEKHMSTNEKNDAVDRYLFASHEQYFRIQKYLDQDLANTKFEKDEPTFKFNLSNRKHSDLILLGLNGNLTIDYLRDLKFLYSNDEYQSLLDELLEWQIFSEEEISKLREIEPKSTVIIDGKDSLDKLVRFFCNNTKEITDANSLRLLKPVIGDGTLNSLVNTLHAIGLISEEVYEQYLTTDKDLTIKK